MLIRFQLVLRSIALWGLTGSALVLLADIANYFGIVDALPIGNVEFLALLAEFEINGLPFRLSSRGLKTPEMPEPILDPA